MSRVPTYHGRFGPEQARRLLWRAGFGPRPGEAERLAKHGLNRAVDSLVHPKSTRLKGPAPRDEDGHPLAPRDAWGHDHCWWLDRMVRTAGTAGRAHDARLARLVRDEQGRRAAVADAAPERAAAPARARLVRAARDRRHAATRRCCCGSTGRRTHKDDVNENYARELQELFCLGAGRGYSERDVREMARALTGFRERMVRRPRPALVPLRPHAPRPRLQAPATASAAASTGATACGSPCATASTRRSS